MIAFVFSLNAAAQLFAIEAPVRRAQRNVSRSCIGKDRVRRIVFIERFEDDDLFAGIDGCHHRGDHAFGRAAGDGDLGFRIDLETEVRACLARDGVAKVFRAPRDRILIDVGRDRLHRFAFDVFRRGEIRKALREIYGAVLQCFTGHLANHGFSKRARLLRNVATFGERRGSHLLYVNQRATEYTKHFGLSKTSRSYGAVTYLRPGYNIPPPCGGTQTGEMKRRLRGFKRQRR